ncbi:MAG: DUF262 domain-containing protein [Planctomycetota bacterium]|jgi:predicted protein tyrosine phosphatase
MNINPTSLKVSQLLGSRDEQYMIPAYQRRYSWREKQLWELVEDITLLDGTDTHLLGSIVCLTRSHAAGINKLELVDGQQRLTTISILLHCLRDRLVSMNGTDEAQELTSLLTAKALGGKPEPKIVLDSIDATEFSQLTRSVQIDQPENPNLARAFELYREWVGGQKLPQLGTFIYRLLNQALVIRLDVSDAKDAFKLFETINNRGLRLSPADIIKNFLLGNAARFEGEALELARLRWAELLVALDGVSSEAFFRYFLSAILKRRVRQSDVIAQFKFIFMKQVVEASQLPDRHYYLRDDDVSDDLDPDDDADDSNEGIEDEGLELSSSLMPMAFEQFLERLVQCGRAYGEIVRANTGNSAIDRHLRNLQKIKSMQTYGFLMYLRVSGCDDKQFQRILKLTESFMLRQHICRKRSSENETVFAKLCDVDAKSADAGTREIYRQFVAGDERFQEEFAQTTFKPGVIDRARYCLEQFELARHGEWSELQVSGTDLVEVEHIVPKKIKTKKAKDEFGDWVSYLGARAEAKHLQYVNRIGNLTLFAGPLNKAVSNNPYHRKTPAYRSSGLTITNELASLYPEFGFDQIDERSAALATEAVRIWPMP